MGSLSIYQSLFNTSQNAFFFAKIDGTILEANQAACDMFGYSEAELKRLGGTSILDTKDELFAQMMRAKQKEGTIKGLLTGIRKNGERFPVMYSSVRVTNENGEEIASIEATEMSEQKKQERQLTRLLEETIQAHQKEEDSRILLEGVLDSVTDGFFIVDRNWSVIFFNRAAEHILQQKEEQLIGKFLWEAFPDLIVLKQHVDYQALVGKNQAIRFREYFARYKIWADVSVYQSEKNISVYFKDVTEVNTLRSLEKLERDVLEMNARPDSVLENTLDFYLIEIENLYPGMICSVLRLKNNRLYNWSAPNLPLKFRQSFEGGEITDNMGSCGTAAYRKEKVVVSDIENNPLWADFKKAALQEGLRACWSFPIINTRNQIMGTFAIYYKQVKSPTKEEENTLERVKNILTIILENRLSVEAVKFSIQSYDMVAKATNDAIWDWNMETNEVIRTGKGMKSLFGYDQEETDADHDFWNKRVHPEDLLPVLERRQVILDTSDDQYWEDEYRFMKKDGNYAYVHDKGYIMRNEEGKAIRLVGATRDISERKENETLMLELNNRLKQRADELAASNIELERFAYIASHDMQEPLRMITSFLQLFKKKYEEQIDETAEQYIHYAMDGADRMKKLIMDLLEYSRVGSNKDDLTEIDTNALLQEVVNVFMGRIEEMNVAVEIDPLPMVRGNRTQLFQLFQNLIGNALKYHSGESPRIQIEGKEEAAQFVFSVRDNGIGIKPIFFEKIFVLFQRLHHKNEYSGTGIGLAICKKIVEKHGGKIWVESEPGKGSCFYFTISKSIEQYRLQ
jgi:PAS domain S-box-containing protein